MKLLYLGTAAAEGIPALFCQCECCKRARAMGPSAYRTRAGALLDGVIKLDFGPDSYKQELDRGLNYASIHSVLITHTHTDHFVPEELALRSRVFAHIYDDKPLMTVYGNERAGELLKGKTGEWLSYSRLHAFETVDIEGYSVTPLEAVHNGSGDLSTHQVLHEGKPFGRFEEAFVYYIEKDGKALLYAHDTDRLTPSDMEFLKGRRLSLVSLDCTNGILDVNYIGHMGAKDNLVMRERLIQNGSADENTVFVANHFSHNGFPGEEELQAALPGFIIAKDGLEIEF